MLRKGLTSFSYGLAALASSLFWVARSQDTWPAVLPYCLLFFFPPLLFVFAYSRFLSPGDASLEAHRWRITVILHGLGAVWAARMLDS